MLVSHKYRFIFIKNGRVASTSTELFFEQYCISDDTINKYNYDLTNLSKNQRTKWDKSIIDSCGIVPARPYRKNNDTYWPHMPLCDVKQLLPQDRFESYIKFANIRNPWDSIVSQYYFARGRMIRDGTFHGLMLSPDQTFEQWLIWITNNLTEYRERRIFRHNYQRIIDISSGEPGLDHVIRYEHLNEDIEKMCKITGITDYNIDKVPLVNHKVRSIKKCYRSYYTSPELIAIVNHLCKDIVDLGNYEF